MHNCWSPESRSEYEYEAHFKKPKPPDSVIPLPNGSLSQCSLAKTPPVLSQYKFPRCAGNCTVFCYPNHQETKQTLQKTTALLKATYHQSFDITHHHNDSNKDANNLHEQNPNSSILPIILEWSSLVTRRRYRISTDGRYCLRVSWFLTYSITPPAITKAKMFWNRDTFNRREAVMENLYVKQHEIEK